MDRRERSEFIGAAIDKGVRDLDMTGVLTDWIVVGCTVDLDKEGDPDPQYFLFFSNGGMLEHVAIGLLAKGTGVIVGDQFDEEE